MKFAAAANGKIQKTSRPPESVQVFIRKMHEQGFNLMDTRSVRLASREEYETYDDGTIRNRSCIAKAWEKVNPNAHDELENVRFPQGLHIFNRNMSGGKSNFFVIAEYTRLRGLRIMFSNPLDPDMEGSVSANVGKFAYDDTGRNGKQLKNEEVVINLSCRMRTAAGFEKWADETVAFIRKISGYKAYNKYYAQTHGHFGYSRGRLLMDLRVDDGRAHEMNVILNMILAHVDFDATGPHNHHFRPLFRDIETLECAVGIVKVPAAEVTMPVHLYDNYTVERFVELLNERRQELNELIVLVNRRRKEIDRQITRLARQRAKYAADADLLEKEIYLLEREISRLRGRDDTLNGKSAPADTTELAEEKKKWINYELESLDNKRKERARLTDILEKELYNLQADIAMLKAQLKQHKVYDLRKRDLQVQIRQRKAEYERKKQERLAHKKSIKEIKTRMFGLEEELGRRLQLPEGMDINRELMLKIAEVRDKSAARLVAKAEIKGIRKAMFDSIRELHELGPSEPEPINREIELPVKHNGRYEAARVSRLIETYKVAARLFNARPENALALIPLPKAEPNGPHITMYVGKEENMAYIMKKYLSSEREFPPYAREIEMRPFLLNMNNTYWNGIAFGGAHPVCEGSLPAVDIVRRILLGDICVAEAEELTRNEMQMVAAFNPTFSDKEEIHFIPISQDKLEELKQHYIRTGGFEKGMERYEDEVRRAEGIREAREFFAERLFEADRELGLGMCTPINPGALSDAELSDPKNLVYEKGRVKYLLQTTLNAINMAWAHYISKKGVATMYDADTHFYVPVKAGRKYVGPMLYGRTAITMPGTETLEMDSESFVSVLHRAKDTGDVKIGAEIYWENKSGVLKIAGARKGNTLYERVLEACSAINVYGRGVPYLFKDVWRLAVHEKFNPESWDSFIHYGYNALFANEKK